MSHPSLRFAGHLPRVIHLVDDTTPGGVMRVLDHITRCPELAAHARHEVRPVPRGTALPQVQADVIVSHLAINWRALPRLIAFRARHAALPLLHVEHSYTEGFVAQNVPLKARFFTLLRTGYALFDRVVAVSGPQGAWLLRRGLVSSASLRVIPSAVDLAPFRAVGARTGPVRVIGGVGRLDRQKGFDVLIAAFRQLSDPDLALHLHGTGPEAAQLRELAAGDPRIRFFGAGERPERIMETLDLVAMPSRWEAFGLVALEARAARRGLVCADVDGLRESGAGARFVRGHNPDEWADALRASLKAPEPAAPPPPSEFAAKWLALLAELGKPQEVAA